MQYALDEYDNSETGLQICYCNETKRRVSFEKRTIDTSKRKTKQKTLEHSRCRHLARHETNESSAEINRHKRKRFSV